MKKKRDIIDEADFHPNYSMVRTEIVDCPRCGNPAVWEGNHITFEQTLICRSCGYSSTDKIVIGKHKTRLYHHKHLAAGVYTIAFKRADGNAVFWRQGRLPDPRRERVEWGFIISWFRKIMKRPEIDPQFCFLTKYDEKKKKLIYLIGHPVELERGDTKYIEEWNDGFSPLF